MGEQGELLHALSMHVRGGVEYYVQCKTRKAVMYEFYSYMYFLSKYQYKSSTSIMENFTTQGPMANP